MSEETLDKSAPANKAAPARRKKPYDPEKLIGKTLAGRYEVEQCIGKGGMGVVYLARQTALGRKVVIKVLPRSFVDDEEAIIRFEREAQGMSRLQHPHIVAIYDFGHDADQAYICMEYVNGETLTERIRREGPTPAQEFAQIASQILQGIGEAHSIGLIHRDIKPSNIMLTERHGRQNYVKILDFGLAKLSAGAADVTKDQALVGSAAYLSPEQIMGKPSDHRVDIYAMGVLFYYMLSGEKPFVSDDDITVLYQHVHQAPQPLGERLPADHRIPDAIIDLVTRMLAKSPDDRPPDAPSILDELIEIMAATSIQVPDLAAQMTTGEFARLTPPGSRAIEDPSAILERDRAHTPQPALGGGLSPDSNSHPQIPRHHSGLYIDSNSDMRLITEEQLAVLQREQSRKTLRIVSLFTVLIIGGLVAAFFIFSPVTDDSTAVLKTTRAQLEEAGTYIEQENFGRAETILALVEPTLEQLPALRPEYAALRDDLETRRLFSRARLYEEEGQPARALETYEQIRQKNPANTDARDAIDRLKATLQAPASAPQDAEPAPEPSAAREETPQQDIETDEAPAASKKPARASSSAAKKPARPSSSARNAASRSEAPAAEAPSKPATEPQAADSIGLLPVGEPQPAEKSNDEDDSPLLQID